MDIYKALKLPQTIYKTHSQYNGDISVTLTGDTTRIKVDGITQSISVNSPLCHKLVWGKLADLVYSQEPDANSVLMFGLAGGTIQTLISNKMPNTYITSVEIDEKMIDIARQYFNLDQIKNHRVINEDALRFVTSPESYGIYKHSMNVVIVDIYIGDDYPDLGRSGTFINAIKDLVVPGGLIIFNRIYTKNHQDDVDLFIKQVSNYLVDVETLPIPGYSNSDNILVYGRVFEHTI